MLHHATASLAWHSGFFLFRKFFRCESIGCSIDIGGMLFESEMYHLSSRVTSSPILTKTPFKWEIMRCDVFSVRRLGSHNFFSLHLPLYKRCFLETLSIPCQLLLSQHSIWSVRARDSILSQSLKYFYCNFFTFISLSSSDGMNVGMGRYPYFWPPK